MRTVAAFDLDGTLTRRDTVLPFLRLVCGSRAVAAALAAGRRDLARVAIGAGDRDRVKADLVDALLAGRTHSTIEAVGERFADRVTARGLRADVVSRLMWHGRRGHEVVIVTAAFAAYASPLGEHLGVDAVLATGLEVDTAGRCTGQLAGANCRGHEKVRRLRAHLGDDDVRLWAYGNSVDDGPLLSLAGQAVLVGRPRLTEAPDALEVARHRERDGSAPGVAQFVHR